MLDTVLRGARIAGADAGADAPLVDIGIAGGTIAAVEPDIRSDSETSAPSTTPTTWLGASAPGPATCWATLRVVRGSSRDATVAEFRPCARPNSIRR